MYKKASNNTHTVSLVRGFLIPKDSCNRDDNHFKVPVLFAYSDLSSLKLFEEIVAKFMEGDML